MDSPHLQRPSASAPTNYTDHHSCKVAIVQVWGEQGPQEALAVERSLAMWELASRVQADPEVSAAAAARGTRLRQRWATRLPRELGGATAAPQRSVGDMTVLSRHILACLCNSRALNTR